MRLSAYGAVNVLLAALWVVFIPSYWMLVHCPTCPPFLKSAGELVEMIWHPNTHRIKLKYGASGRTVFNPGSDDGAYRPVCVPCPELLIKARSVGFLNSSVQTSGTVKLAYSAAEEDMLRCVKVTGFNLPQGKTLTITGGAAVDAKHYVQFQLFGRDYEAIFKKLYTSPSGKTYREPLEWTDMRKRLSNYGGATAYYNQSLFKKMSPWPFVNAPIVYPDGRSDSKGVPSTTSYGFYLMNGRPFIPPKLWDYRVLDASRGDLAYKQPYTILSNMGSQPPGANYTPSFQMVDQSGQNIPKTYGGQHWGSTPPVETEWWYGNLCPKDSGCGDTWWQKTSLQYWGDEHYLDYIGRFFAGGDSLNCIWVPK